MSDHAKSLRISPSKFKYRSWIYWITLLTGAVNVYSIQAFGIPVTHQTGNTSGLAIRVYEGSSPAYPLIGLLLCFFAGSFFSGLFYHQRTLTPQKRYGWPLILGGVMLMVLETLGAGGWRLYLMTFWMGLQNGMFLIYEGALIRTSHMTGYLTDAGFALGAYIRGDRTQVRKVKFYIFSVIFFVLGGILGSVALDYFRYPLRLIGLMYVLCGGYYFYLRHIELADAKVRGGSASCEGLCGRTAADR